MKNKKFARLIKKNIFLIALIILTLSSYFYVYKTVDTTSVVSKPIRSDGEGYYGYLPAYLIHHDFSFKKVKQGEGRINPPIEGLDEFPGGRYCIKYGIGEAVMLLPFFILAHVFSLLLNFPANGYSFLYQHLAGLAGLTYFILGIIILKKYLERDFTKKITVITLAIIIFGTNLFHYATYDSVFSHIFSFFLFSSFLYLINDWYEKKDTKTSILIGIVMGMIFITRYSNVLVWLIFPLYGVLKLRHVKVRFSLFFKKHIKETLAVSLSLFMIVFIQLLSWKLSTGYWIVYSYGSERFNFLKPQIFELLFSISSNGLFFWSPVLIFGVLSLILCGKKNKLFWPSIIFFVLFIYITSSWHLVSYGAGFGARVFVETLPIFAFWIALFIKNLPKNKALNAVFYFFVIAMVSVTLIQMIGYWQRLLPFEGSNLKIWLKSLKHYLGLLWIFD